MQGFFGALGRTLVHGGDAFVEMTTALWCAGGLILLLILLQVFAAPLKLLLKLVAQSLAGGLALWLLNMAGRHAGLHLPLNPVSAVVVGVLGLPGLVVLGAARFFLG